MRGEPTNMHFEGVGRFGNVVFCDDVRKEDNGKFLLIGMYSSILTLFQMPGKVWLRTFVEFQSDRLGDVRLDFEFRIDGIPMARFDGSVSQMARDDGVPMYVTLPLPPAEFDISTNCTLHLFAISGDSETKIRSLVISGATANPA